MKPHDPIEDLLRRRPEPGAPAGGPLCGDPELLAAYAERVLDGSARDEFESHLAHCNACREAVAALARMSPRELPTPAASPAGTPAATPADAPAATPADVWRWIWALPAFAALGLGVFFLMPGKPSERAPVMSAKNVPQPLPTPALEAASPKPEASLKAKEERQEAARRPSSPGSLAASSPASSPGSSSASSPASSPRSLPGSSPATSQPAAKTEVASEKTLTANEPVVALADRARQGQAQNAVRNNSASQVSGPFVSQQNMSQQNASQDSRKQLAQKDAAASGTIGGVAQGSAGATPLAPAPAPPMASAPAPQAAMERDQRLPAPARLLAKATAAKAEIPVRIEKGVLSISIDAGRVWQAIKTPEEVESAKFDDPLNGEFRSVTHVLYRTKDGGKTWVK